VGGAFRQPWHQRLTLDALFDALQHALLHHEVHRIPRMPDTDSELVIQTVRDQMETDLLVASADEAVAAIRRAGGQVAVERFDIPIGRCAVVRDPWGNVLVLLDGTKGSLTTDSDGVVLTVASGAPRLKPRP
jgi:hypothetical protein